jgi:hypothetical protein
MKVAYSVTFEFAERPPVTHRGTVAASLPATCVSRAVKEAQKALQPYYWTSMVCVLLERLDDDTADASESEPDTTEVGV